MELSEVCRGEKNMKVRVGGEAPKKETFPWQGFSLFLSRGHCDSLCRHIVKTKASPRQARMTHLRPQRA